MMSQYNAPIEKHVKVSDCELKAVDLLASVCPEISRQKLKQAMKLGAVWITRGKKTNRIRRVKKPLLKGDELHLYFDEKVLFSEIAQAILVSDEGDYSVWNKPCGMFSQGTKWGDHSSICRWVEVQGLPQRPTFLVHRLDRATSGLIIVAHSKKIATKLSSLFENRLIEKHYKATVVGQYPFEQDKKLIDEEIDGKKATTIVLESQSDENKNQSFLRLKIETGRKHQIRRHLSSAGFPIVGDRLYGMQFNESISGEGAGIGEIPDLQLQSCYFKFVCPVSGALREYQL